MTAGADDRHAYRCPRPGCGHTFHDPALAAGRVVACPGCGRAMNARPLSMDRELAERERTAASGRGDPDLVRLPLAVLADNVRSLWNVGSMFRTADACGVRMMVLAGVTGCPPRDGIAKTALGAEAAVAWRYRADELGALREIEGEGYTPVAVENGPAGSALPAFEWPERPCLVVGNEVRGLSPHVLEACPRRVSIPMLGRKETLNVAVAFGIVAHRAAEVLAGRERTR
jgi:tRNA G18 (ribose-2'-O)-methylase SpoU